MSVWFQISRVSLTGNLDPTRHSQVHREDPSILGFDRELLPVSMNLRDHPTLQQSHFTRSSGSSFFSTPTIDEIRSIQPDFPDFRSNDVGAEISTKMFYFRKFRHALFQD